MIHPGEENKFIKIWNSCFEHKGFNQMDKINQPTVWWMINSENSLVSDPRNQAQSESRTICQKIAGTKSMYIFAISNHQISRNQTNVFNFLIYQTNDLLGKQGDSLPGQLSQSDQQ